MKKNEAYQHKLEWHANRVLSKVNYVVHTDAVKNYIVPKLAEDKNIRDYTDLLHLVILNNLENSNAEFIKLGISQSERLIRLNESARNQMEILKNNHGIKKLEILQRQINENNKYLIENK